MLVNQFMNLGFYNIVVNVEWESLYTDILLYLISNATEAR